MVAVAPSSALPRSRLPASGEEHRVAVGAEHEPVRGARLGESGSSSSGSNEEHRGARVVDDVRDLGRGQSEVDRDQDPSPTADAEERGEQAGGVVGDDRHPLASAHSQPVEAGRLGAGPLGQFAEGQRGPWRGRLVAARRRADPLRDTRNSARSRKSRTLN